ncbi:MAG: hypothetical protein M3P83_00845 [Actinomycetota bacterium]|nr:hypothetical protein [Actinomycetota bacterium]
MKLYADTTRRRLLQVAGDALLLLWILVWWGVGRAVYDGTAALAAPGRVLEDAGTSLSGALDTAADRARDVPLVGDALGDPIGQAGAAAQGLAEAGQAQQAAVLELALLLGLVTALVPILLAAAVWVPARVRFVRRATAARRLLGSSGDVDLFALRALTRQPMHRLARVDDDPVAAWRRGDREVVRRLAELELRASGLRRSAHAPGRGAVTDP